MLVALRKPAARIAAGDPSAKTVHERLALLHGGCRTEARPSRASEPDERVVPTDTMLKIGGQSVPAKTLLLFTSDALLIVLGLLAATALRFLDFGHVVTYFTTPHSLIRFVLVVIVCEVVLYYCDLYDFSVIDRSSELLVNLLQALGIACVALALLYYMKPELSLGRGIAFLAAPLILLLTLGWRVFLNRSGLWHHRPERVLIVGTGSAGIQLTREIGSRLDLSMRVVGFLDEKGENIGKSLVNPGIIGATFDVETIAEREKVDRVVVSLAERRGKTPMRELLRLKFERIPVEDAYSLYERISGRILLEHLSPSWLIFSDGFRKSALSMAAKRTMDVVLSFLAIVVTLPLTGLVALAIWIETGRPILYRQTRAGLQGRLFQMLKFRSMVHAAEQGKARWAQKGDHRITRVGRWIRRYRLDELPQFFNVLRGEMSIVGPRPERPEFCAMLEKEIPLFALRHSVRPGITGWAQIKYQYGASVEESKTKLEYDLFYIKHLSALLDLAILFETAKVMLYGRGAK